MEGDQEGVVAVEPGSAPAVGDPGSQAPAGAENTGQQPTQGQPNEQRVPYARFQQVVAKNRDLETRLAQLEQYRAKAEQQGGQLSPQDQQQYREAATALKQVLAADPQLAFLLRLAANPAALEQSMQGVASLTKAQQAAEVRQGIEHIAGLAKAASLPVDNQKFVTHLVRMVAQEALTLPDGAARYDAGDVTVLEEAFKNIQKEIFGGFTRAANGTLLKTKQATAALPPAPRGGFAGQPAPAKPVEGKEREYTQSLHKRALSLLEDRLSG